MAHAKPSLTEYGFAVEPLVRSCQCRSDNVRPVLEVVAVTLAERGEPGAPRPRPPSSSSSSSGQRTPRYVVESGNRLSYPKQMMNHMDASATRLDTTGHPTMRPLLLRYVLTLYIWEAGTASVAELVDALERDGHRVSGRPSKVVSDALRWEIAKGRVIRVGRGRYRVGVIPRSTLGWIRVRVNEVS